MKKTSLNNGRNCTMSSKKIQHDHKNKKIKLGNTIDYKHTHSIKAIRQLPDVHVIVWLILINLDLLTLITRCLYLLIIYCMCYGIAFFLLCAI